LLENIKNILSLKHPVIGSIDITIRADGNDDIDLVVLKKKKSLITRQAEVFALKSFDEIKKHIKQGSPLAISVDGKGIIHKKIQYNEDMPIISQTLPNAKADDFYIQVTDISDNEKIISLVRKEQLNKVMQHLSDLGLFVVSVAIGPFSLKSIVSHIQQNKNRIVLKHSELILHDDRIIDIQKKDDDFISITHQVFDEKMQTEALIPFASGINYFSDTVPVDITIEPVEQQKEAFRYKKLFDIGYKMVLVLFFVILLLNYLLFEHYKSMHNALSYSYQQNEGLISQYEEFKNELGEKESLIEKSGLLSSSRFSYYADRLANSLPYRIILTELAIHPVLKKVREDKQIAIEKNTIIIKGLTPESTLLNEWIRSIKKDQWAYDVVINNYNQENEYSKGAFQIKIIIDQNQ
jgi:Tfp pilus assembly protein PilN